MSKVRLKDMKQLVRGCSRAGEGKPQNTNTLNPVVLCWNTTLWSVASKKHNAFSWCYTSRWFLPLCPAWRFRFLLSELTHFLNSYFFFQPHLIAPHLSRSWVISAQNTEGGMIYEAKYPEFPPKKQKQKKKRHSSRKSTWLYPEI